MAQDGPDHLQVTSPRMYSCCSSSPEPACASHCPIAFFTHSGHSGGPALNSLGEVIGALLRRGLVLEAFEEYDYSPHACFTNAVEIEPNKYQWRGFEGVLPMSYALRAKKP